MKKRTEGLSTILVDLRRATGHGLTICVRFCTMMNHATTELFFDNLEVPADNLIGEEGQGFRYLLDSLNAERRPENRLRMYWRRALVHREGVPLREGARGLWLAGHWAESGRPIPYRPRLCESRSSATDGSSRSELVRWLQTMWRGSKHGHANCSRQTLPGRPPTWHCKLTEDLVSPRSIDIERKFRETRLYQVAPISTNLILSYLGEHVLGLPRSY